MALPSSDSTQNTFNISNSPITNLVGSGTIQYNEADRQRETQTSSASNQGSRSSLDSAAEEQKKTILILAANPKSAQRLRLDEEVREIDAGLQRSRHRDRFILETKWAVRPRDMQRAMLDIKPQIVHFAGHGKGEEDTSERSKGIIQNKLAETRKLVPVQVDGLSNSNEGLYLEDEVGQSKLIDLDALAGLFELFVNQVECVVLNACYSEAQAKAIAQHIPYVIGMNTAIGDRAAIEFAVAFYDALGAGEPIEFSYKLGCSAIRLAGIAEHLTPVLNKK